MSGACNSGQVSRKDAAGCILFAVEKATWMALEAIQVLGGNGYVHDFPTGRLLRDAKLYEIGAGTSEIRRILTGREAVPGDRLTREQQTRRSQSQGAGAVVLYWQLRFKNTRSTTTAPNCI